MNELTFVIPTLFGVEGIAAEELRRMGMQEVRADNGRVFCQGQPADIPRLNLRLRTGERVLIHLGSFPAATFDQLFEGTRKLPWDRFIPPAGQFPVKGHSLSSALHSVPACQSIVKKAVATRLGKAYHQETLPETGALYQIQFSLMKDVATLLLDTSGPGLYKRGYRAVGNDAPLRETLAAALVTLARYRGKGNFVDPFCGSGTIAIEAAMIARNRAPGLQRSFSCQKWAMSDEKLWQEARTEAMDKEFHGDYHIFGSDIDPKSLAIARSNAKKAGMDGLISFSEADATKLVLPDGPGVIVTNPPYGQRMLEQRQAQHLLRDFGRHMKDQTGYGIYIISSEEELERYYGRKCRKKRKLYNGMIKCNLFMYSNE